jgi:orotidine 5''-phosphate decarboxylase, subfamily 2
MIIDKLYKKVDENGPVCLGLDTSLDYIPEGFLKKYESVTEALFNFNKEIIDETNDICGCFKVQIAYYEAYGVAGLQAYKKTLEYLKSMDAVTIADIKRGDIAKTAEMYAAAHFTGDFESDFVTLNPYMGMDSIEPYLPYVEKNEKGIFALVRTSNPGAKDIEFIETKDNQKVYNIVGDKINAIAEKYIGESGYSSIGAVMGCTQIEEVKELRKKYKNMFFLIPGYGAQGGKAEDVAEYLNNGNGGVVNNSRGILLAYKKVENGEANFAACSREEVLKMRSAIKTACK